MSINQEVWTWAEWASSKTGIPAEIIYTHWHLEAGEKGIENPASKSYNLAGLTVSGTPGIWRKYSSLSNFAYDYVYGFLMKNYPQTIEAKDISTFVSGLKAGKIGSYFGEESIGSYLNKLQNRYESLFGGNPLSAYAVNPGRPIWEGQELKPSQPKPKWREIWDNFVDDFKTKVGLTKPEWEQELEARKYVEEKAKEKGIPVSEEFKQNTQILEDYQRTQQEQGTLERILMFIIGIVLLIVGAIFLAKDVISQVIPITNQGGTENV